MPETCPYACDPVRASRRPTKRGWAVAALATLVIASGWLAPRAASALRPPLDQVFPDEPAAPVAKLVAHAPGGAFVHGDDKLRAAFYAVGGDKVGTPSQTTSPQVLHEAKSGAFWRFLASDSAAGTGTEAKPHNGGMLVIDNDRPKLFYSEYQKTAMKRGMTWSLFYRHPTGAAKIDGWNPLFTVGKRALVSPPNALFPPNWLNWSFGVMLHKGKPHVVDKSGTWISSAKTLSNNPIDDGQWHHVALRMSFPGTYTGSHSQLALFVDGSLVWTGLGSDRVATHPTFQSLRLGRAHNDASEYPGQSNYVDLNKSALLGKSDGALKYTKRWLNSVADIDDVRVYLGPLSLGELYRLSLSRERGLRLQVPDFDPERARLSWKDGEAPGALTAVQGFVTDLQGLPLSKTSDAAQVTAMGSHAIATSGGQPAGHDTVRGQLSHMTAHTVMAWLSLPDDTVPLLSYAAKADGWGWTLGSSKGRKLTLKCGDKTLTGDPQATWGKAWGAVTVSVDAAGNVKVTRNFQKVLSGSCGAPPTSDSTATLTLPRPDQISVAWLHVVDAALTMGQQHALASPGPLRHVRPPSLTDLSGLHDVAPYNGTNGKMLVPLVGSAPGETPRTADRSLTVAATFSVTKASTTFYHLFARQGSGFGKSDLTTITSCVSLGFGTDFCQLTLMGHPPSQKGSLLSWKLNHIFYPNTQVRLAFTDPVWRKAKAGDATTWVLQPYVALNGALLTKGNGYANPVGPYLTSPATGQPLVYANTLPTNEAGAISLDAQQFATSPATIQVADLRVYGYRVMNLHEVGATCAQLKCGDAGRVCVPAKAGSHGGAYCGGCDADHLKFGGVTGFRNDCVKKLAFNEPCGVSFQCASGHCTSSWSHPNRCTAPTASVCSAFCGARGRTCSASAPWVCGGCKQDFVPLPPWTAGSTHPDLTCEWQPTIEAGEVCERDGQCFSGKCATQILEHRTYIAKVEDKWQTGDYKVSYGSRIVTSKVCGTKDKAFCTDLPQRTVVEKQEVVTPPHGGTPWSVYFCKYGDAGACQPNYQRRPAVLSWQACKTARTILWGLDHNQGQRHAAVSKWSGLDVRRLKHVFLNDPKAVQQGDVIKLEEAGVGPLLLAYAQANATEKAAMKSKYGYFEPLSFCDASAFKKEFPSGAWSTSAYGSSANRTLCVAKRLPNGSPCPPKGEEQGATKPNAWCKSEYCRRDTATCDDAVTTASILKGKGGNQSKSGESNVRFGVVRVDQTSVELKEDPNKTAGSDEYKYKARLQQKHVLCLFGKPAPAEGIFVLDMDLDRSEGTACGTTRVTTKVAGLTTSAPKPDPIAGSCTNYSGGAGSGWSVCDNSETTCSGPDLDKWKDSLSLAQLIPTLKFCVPVDDLALPEYQSPTFWLGPVPLGVKAGPSVDACVSLSVAVDSSGFPQLEVAPELGLGAEIRGGISLQYPGIDVAAGVKLAVTLVGLRLPITFGMSLSDVFETKNGKKKHILGMFELEIFAKIALEISVLNGEFSLFAEVAFGGGIFTMEWTLPIFEWTAFKWTYNLLNEPLYKKTLDFKAEFQTALKGSANAVCNADACYK